jgi:virulence factor Mce-like protein
MITRKRLVLTTAVILALLIAGSAVFVVRQTFFRPKSITAYFTTATAVYPGDDVKVSGMKVGTIASIRPQGTLTALTLTVDRDVPVPADANAVIVAQNLLAARYVQLAPAYRSGGPTMRDGAVIPVERTAIPVEWDEVKQQLMRLATDLGPKSDVSSTSVSRFIDSASNALGGNGDKLRTTLAQLSAVGRILADGGGNIAALISNLQTFITALRDSGEQMVQFQDRLATLSSVLNDSRSDFDAALTTLSSAVGEVQRFVAGTRDKTSEQIQRLANVTQILVDHKMDLENILHGAPNAFSNGYGIYNPDTGGAMGAFVFNNFSNPLQFICGSVGAVENVTSSESAKLCEQYFGPALKLLSFNNIAIPVNPFLAKSASPDNIIYSDPALAPGGQGAGPSQGTPPAVSAYTGLNGDVPPPPGWDSPPGPPGAFAPNGLPADPSPALYPGAPIPPGVPAAPLQNPTNLPELLAPPGASTPSAAPPSLQQMLLPAEASSPALPTTPAPLSAEGTPPS